MITWRIVLFPFQWIYALILKFRHFLFDKGILKSHTFPVPVIGVGNLNFGGSGKTPMIEYLINLLSKYHVAVLSRGYGRKTSGFIIANQYSTANDIGDEPLLFYKKYKNKITVAVDENRVRGIKNLLQSNNKIQVILLDDSFQHRYVKPGINILLTTLHKLYVNDHLFPVGSLRDLKSAAKNADIIMVTKTDIVLSPIIKKDVLIKLKPLDHQKVYFSYYKYKKFIPAPEIEITPIKKNKPTVIILFTGIANPWPLKTYLKRQCSELVFVRFKDHHKYSLKDIDKIIGLYEEHFSMNKIIVTTEKDIMRLLSSPYYNRFDKKPLYYIPVKNKIHKEFEESFNKQILDYVGKNKRNS